MPERPDLVYLYDGSFDGLLSAVFDAWREPAAAIFAEGCVQLGFGQRICVVETSEEKARRVEAGITAKIGTRAYQTLWAAFWSGNPEKDTVIHRYLHTAFRLGRKVHNALALEEVAALEYLARNVERESQHLRGFVRFAELEGGVFYSRIDPKNSLVPLLMPHFTDRFSDMPFLLHDTAHDLIGVYDLQNWHLVEAKEVPLSDYTETELHYRRLWRRFYDAIAVQERISHRRRRQMMPMYYWKNLPELQPRSAKDPKNTAIARPIDTAQQKAADESPPQPPAGPA